MWARLRERRTLKWHQSSPAMGQAAAWPQGATGAAPCPSNRLRAPATGRSLVQLLSDASRAPLAYGLSAVAAVIYIVATVCLALGDRARRVAIAACSIELAGVLVVGAASYAAPDLFPDKTVWSHFGQGYGYLPLLLPIVGLWWLLRPRRA